MVLTCINYSLYHLIIAGRTKEAFKDEELRVYLLIIFVAWIAMALNLLRTDNSGFGLLETLRHTAFQAISYF